MMFKRFFGFSGGPAVLFAAFFFAVSFSASAVSEEMVSYHLDGARVEILPELLPPAQRSIQPGADDAFEEEQTLRFTLTGLDESATRKYIEQYSSKEGIKWLTAVMKRSEPYQSFIKKEIERRGLPEELIYLPVIESGYSTGAVSRAGATGLWQFMRNSISPYDMKINEWMDERRDFWKSTMGALSKLEDNYNELGSWELALAAYNAGTGTIKRALKRYPNADYWELCRKRVFRNETIQYIPRLLAVSYILSNPRRFGLELSWPDDPEWTLVPVSRSVDLSLLAEHAGLAGTELKKANGELYYGITPPDSNYQIKVPSSHKAAIESVLADTEIPLIKYYFHTIHSGDTLSEIAQRYGIPISQITSHNPGLRPQYLKIGQRLIIPAIREGRVNTSPSPAAVTVSSSGTHRVQRGESLWSIALAYNTDPETLASANGMNVNGILREGKLLKTPR
jgi:membrane-bound lytic murein transglycosylase D